MKKKRAVRVAGEKAYKAEMCRKGRGNQVGVARLILALQREIEDEERRRGVVDAY